jgi:hypothetical protein
MVSYVRDVTNHAPIAATVEWALTVESGARVSLDASSSHDEDGDKWTYRWTVYTEASTFEGTVEFHGAGTSQRAFRAPNVTDARPSTQFSK